MQRLVNAVVALIKATPALAAMAGTSGPFWGIAPERTAFPYIVITQISGLENQQGFGSVYVARSQLQFSLYGADLATVATNTEAFCAAFDVISSLSLTSPEVTRKPIRIEEPRYLSQPIAADGSRPYAGIVQYRFNVQRTRGS